MRNATIGSAPAAPLSGDLEVMGLVGFAHAASHFLQLLLPPLFPWLMSQFALSFTRVGALMTALFVTSGIGQALAGFLVDRLGARRVLLSGLALIAAAALLVASATTYAVLFTAAVLAGIGNAVFHPADFSLLNRHVSPARLGYAFSAHGLTGYLGWAAAPVTIAGVAAWAGWRTAAVVGASVALVMLVVLLARRAAFAAPHAAVSSERANAVSARSGSPLGFLCVSTIWMCFLFFLLSTLASGALQNFAPTVLQATHGLSLRTATAALTLYMLGGAAGMAAGGFLAGQGGAHGRRIAVALGAAALTAVAIALGAIPSWTVPPAIALIGFCSGTAGPSRDLLVRRAAMTRFGPRSFGRIYGFVYSGFDVGGATAPLVFAGFLDRGMFRHVLVGVAVLQVLALLTALDIGRANGAPQNDVVVGS